MYLTHEYITAPFVEEIILNTKPADIRRVYILYSTV